MYTKIDQRMKKPEHWNIADKIDWLTFMGKSSPDEDLWRHTPRSAEPEGKYVYHVDLGIIIKVVTLIF